jgi:Sulfotransferase domain
MSSRLRRSLKSAKRRAQHALGIRRDEVTVISFPKSGRTWLQVMLGEYITRCYGLDARNVMALKEYTKRLEGVPRIRFAHDERPQWKMSHQLNRDKSGYRDQRVVLLVRDPRDILVSLYFEKTKRVPARRKDRPEFKGSIDEFVYYELGGIDSIIAFFNNWANSRNIPRDFKIVKYEDLRRDTRNTLIDMLSYLGLEPVNEHILEKVLELGDINKMRAREAESARGSHSLRRSDPQAGDAFETRAFQPADPSDPESYKVRKGKVGGYVDYLENSEIEYLNRKISEELDPLFAY